MSTWLHEVMLIVLITQVKYTQNQIMDQFGKQKHLNEHS